jgi:hypothetical protein
MDELPKSDEKCPFCAGPLGGDPRRICENCKMTDRHRCVRTVYQALRPLTLNMHCLNLSADRIVTEERYFAKLLNSTFGGHAHIDLQSIKYEDDYFDFAVCNHILEHVKDDKLGMRELMRVTSKAAQITVPVPTKFYATEEYGAPKPSLYYHWRHYGADFGSRVKEVVPHCHVLVTAVTDAPSGNHDTSYLVIKDLEFAKLAFQQFTKSKVPCIVIS